MRRELLLLLSFVALFGRHNTGFVCCFVSTPHHQYHQYHQYHHHHRVNNPSFTRSAPLYAQKNRQQASFLALPLSEELGVSGGIFQNKFFDPMNFATDENFVRYREAELKHCRVAMLATVGMIVPEVLRDSNMFNKFVNPLVLSPSKSLAFGDVPNGVRAIFALPLLGWLQIIAFIGILEVFVWKQRSQTALPGDYGTGFFGLNNYGKHESLLQRELEYGRLAMIGVVLQVLWELIMKTTVGEPYKGLLDAIFKTKAV